MQIYKHQYHDIVRVEIQSKSKDEEVRQMKSISFIKTTLVEVINHVVEKSKPCLVVEGGVKVKITIRISHPIKRWGDQKNYTLRISSIDALVEQLTTGLEEF